MDKFVLHSEFAPTGDQPQAIEALVNGFKEGNQCQTLLGVTGSGKLIVHSRGEIVEKDNLIALEMKKSYRPLIEKEKDRARLVALTRDSYDGVWSFDGKTLPEHVCGYELGIYYEIDKKCNLVFIEYYAKGEKIRSYQRAIK